MEYQVDDLTFGLSPNENHPIGTQVELPTHPACDQDHDQQVPRQVREDLPSKPPPAQLLRQAANSSGEHGLSSAIACFAGKTNVSSSRLNSYCLTRRGLMSPVRNLSGKFLRQYQNFMRVGKARLHMIANKNADIRSWQKLGLLRIDALTIDPIRQFCTKWNLRVGKLITKTQSPRRLVLVIWNCNIESKCLMLSCQMPKAKAQPANRFETNLPLLPPGLYGSRARSPRKID